MSTAPTRSMPKGNMSIDGIKLTSHGKKSPANLSVPSNIATICYNSYQSYEPLIYGRIVRVRVPIDILTKFRAEVKKEPSSCKAGFPPKK